MSHQLRPARQEDAPAIRRLIRQSGINPLGLDWRRFLLAVDDQDRCIGCGQLKPHAGGSLELASIAVVPEYRKQGVASQIIEALIERSKTLPITRQIQGGSPALYLTCRAGLGPFYSHFGFQVLAPGEMPGYFKGAYAVFQFLKRLKLTHENLLVMRRGIDL